MDFTAKSDGDLTKKINIRVSPSVPLDPLFDLPQVKMFENVRPDGSAVRLIITYNTVYSDAKWDIKWKGKTPELLVQYALYFKGGPKLKPFGFLETLGRGRC